MSKLSRITFGTWGLSEWGQHSRGYCLDLCKSAFTRGITSFDTAAVYANGRSEEFLSFLPKECFIATKIPAKNRSKRIDQAYEELWITKCVDASRKRLNRDSLDLVQIHNWDYEWRDYHKLLNQMEYLKEKGIVKNWGVSLPFEAPNSENKVFDEPIIEYFQVHYNLLQQQNRALITSLRQDNKHVLLRSVLLHGFLLNSINPPFQEKYGAEESELAEKREKLFGNVEKEKRLHYCLDDAFSTGADSVVLGIIKKSHLQGIEKYL